jgi:hypothetical protein
MISKLPWSFMFAMLVMRAMAGSDPAVIKAKVEEPVLEELMGGCSLKCAFAWGVEIEAAPPAPAATPKPTGWFAFWQKPTSGPTPAPAAKPTPTAKPVKTKVLNDDSAETAWTALDGTTGVGVKFKFIFPKKLIPELEGTPLYGLDLINGNWKTEELWKANGRVKKARLYYNGKPFRDLTFADSRRWERVSFPDIEIHSGDSMTFEILEIYPGEKGAGAAISEIVLQGAH